MYSITKQVKLNLGLGAAQIDASDKDAEEA